jgi:hypothetical protein
MVAATRTAFLQAGYRSEQIITERFDYRQRRNVDTCAKEGAVTRP